jgi:uncharacterized surface protein with fasciclin (FAS1) repeats
MKAILLSTALLSLGLCVISCGGDVKKQTTKETAKTGGIEMVKDDVSQKNVVQIAAGSADHTTLVAALQAADLVNALSNQGPFTVFAPTNAAFDKLPKGTLDELLKAEKKSDLKSILYGHVIVGAYKESMFRDGQEISVFSGNRIKMGVKGGKITINGSVNVVASIPATNGIIHVVDGVLLPTAK